MTLAAEGNATEDDALVPRKANEMETQSLTVIDPIYEGTTTILYRGLRGPERTKIVLKTHRTEIPTARDLGRLRHEFAILQQIDVPGVVKPIALTTYKNHLALVLEDAPGRSLHTILRAGPLELATALRVAIALCRILAALHDQHILHRDVKPQNILLDEVTGAVHLVDFGMATRLAQGIQQPSAPDALEGTLAYMAPEQTGRMNRVIDARSDLYALGVTLYEMTTGALPFMAADAMAMVHSHIARMPAPPRDLAPRLPQVVSDLILKLLAKAAEDRYQTARGLEADLAECLKAWEATDAVAPFPLGRHDMTSELRLPQKLYGRARELEALVAAFGRARRGAAELLLVSGPSGVGKSALVHEVHKSIARGGGHFIEGKFDQLSRGVPYAPIARAFGDLCAKLMSERREALDRDRERIRGAVGAAGRVLTDLIPELARLLGPQPPVPAVGTTEAQSRFNLAFRALLGAVATAEHPLVLFLDDLQWADLASLQLLHTLLADGGSAHVLFVGAYRDAEVSAAHPLSCALAELRRAGAAISEVTLALLGEDDITELVTEALSCDRARGEALGRLIHGKTFGNPFFVGQLLGALRDEGLLRFDASSRSWQWSPEAIARHDVADNVVSLMVQRLERLAPAARRLVTLAACVGHRFDLTTLALINERKPVETASELWEALREGLVLPLDDAYRLLHQADAAAPLVELDALAGQIAYRFLHDRVQQAAYSLLDEADKPAVHLRIGRLLLARRARGEVGDESLFDLVHHLGLGAAQIQDPLERLALVRLDLAAARRAKGAAAYEAASRYAEAGVALLGDAIWAEEHALAFALHLEAAECSYLRGDAERAEALFGVLLARARAKHEAAQVHDLRMILCSTLGRYVEAIEAGRASLALFGVYLPTSDEAMQSAIARELAAVPENLRGRAIEDLLDAPLMEDPDQQRVASLLTTLADITYLTSPLLCTLVATLNVNVSLKHGTAATTPYAYTTYGFVLIALEQRYDDAYAFAEVGLALNEKLGNASLECKLCNNFGVFTAHWKRPVSVPLAYLERGTRAGLASGDLIYVGYSCWQISVLKLCRGDEFGELREEVTSLLAQVRQTGSPFASALQVITKQLVEALSGGTQGPLSLSSDGFDEAELLRSIQSPGFAMVECWYHATRLMLLYLHGDHAGALAEAREAEARAGSAVAMFFTSELTFFRCLALAAAYEGAPAEERPALDAELAEGQATLARWSTACPENFEHKALLVAAEAARLSGDALGAMRLYDQAIASARAHDFPHHEALACELAAGLYLGRDLYHAAGDYLIRAYQGYLRWGAAVKAASLLERHGVLLGRHVTEAAALAASTVTTTSRGTSSAIDVATVSSAAEAVAGEIVLDRLLARLMSIALSNAGAQRGFLLAERAGKVTIEAAMTISPDSIRILPGTTLEESEESDELSAMVVRYVLQSDTTIVLGDAAEEGRFAADPYIEAHRPRSLLCMPVAHQGRSSGVLYLENNLAPDAFTKERVELLRLLSTHAAIAIENARLHAQSKEVSAELQRANARLEGEAEQREESLRAATAQLREANLDLSARTEELRRANDRLHAELAGRAEAESERAELQEAIIRVQRERLEELSTPLIPITDQIVVMPLIGTMDAGRADQVLETALQGAQASRAQVVIIDITGMTQVDAIVADKLIKTASALRLLGAQVALTGIRPDAAQALVGLGIDMSGIATLGSLQSGIAYALSQTGRAGLLSRGAESPPSGFASLSPLGARPGRG